MSSINGAFGFRLTAQGTPLERYQLASMEPSPCEVIIEVAGCGVCHTDVGFARGGVPTRHPLPLILGHEISGRVIAAGEDAGEWAGRRVIVPAVIPCDDCPACQAGRVTLCCRQFMPGNDGDGGFATHVKVPARGLCSVPEELPAGITLEALSVVADAVTTPYEAICRAHLTADDVAVFVGVGGVGGFGVQIAAALGAAVAAIDVDSERLDLVAQHGASACFNAKEMDARGLKKAVRGFAKEAGRNGIGLKVFETSGTTAGQQTAFGLLDHGGYLAVVGYTREKSEFRLSNLMALDATARGNWGCPPSRYPEVLHLVLDGKVVLEPYIERYPLDEAAQVFEAVADHAVRRRVVLVPALNNR